ncbi:hypothetical protein WT33_33150 [Burkholderia stagnalis]|nr:hypothetical protein WT33_33150 [Burkholderia stagnalis]
MVLMTGKVPDMLGSRELLFFAMEHQLKLDRHTRVNAESPDRPSKDILDSCVPLEFVATLMSLVKHRHLDDAGMVNVMTAPMRILRIHQHSLDQYPVLAFTNEHQVFGRATALPGKDLEDRRYAFPLSKLHEALI